jgi:diguanylate cyclase (GGDEF)-like protein
MWWPMDEGLRARAGRRSEAEDRSQRNGHGHVEVCPRRNGRGRDVTGRVAPEHPGVPRQGHGRRTDDHRFRRLEQVVAVQHVIATSDLPQQDLLELLAEQTMAMVGGDGSAVEYLDGLELVYVATAGCLTGSTGTRLARAGSMSGLAADTDTVLVCQDAMTDVRAHQQACQRLGIGSMILVPLRAGPSIVAVLKIAWRNPHAVPEHAQTDLSLVSDVLAARLAHTHALTTLQAQQRDNDHARAALQVRTDQLSAYVDATRAILLGEHARQAVCHAALTAAGGVCAVIFEPDEDGGLTLTASEGLPVGQVSLRPDEPSISLEVWRTGKGRFLNDVHTAPGTSPKIVTMLDMLSDSSVKATIWIPILADDRACVGVLAVILDRPLRGSTVELLGTLELLAAEAAIAFSREDLRRDLGEQAHTDALTGLANRRRWNDTLDAALATAVRDDSPLTVGILDLDLFKAYNDTHGHPAGDALLSRVSRAWQGALRDGDLLARLGGEEFGLLLPGCRLEAAIRLADLLRGLVPEDQTVSVGLTEHHPTDAPTDVMGRADLALYGSKSSGRNRVSTVLK